MVRHHAREAVSSRTILLSFPLGALSRYKPSYSGQLLDRQLVGGSGHQFSPVNKVFDVCVDLGGAGP